MPRERTGSIFKREKTLSSGKTQTTWWARITYTDSINRKRHDLQRRAKNKAHAKDLVEKLLSDYDSSGGRVLVNERKTFDHLAIYYEKNFLKKAEYINGRKVSGLRSLHGLKTRLNVMREYFGSIALRSITYSDLSNFRLDRLRSKTAKGTQRSIASVNRELAMLRRMLNIAVREDWIIVSPFSKGESLITVADEVKRERILTREEESTLLHVCESRNRIYLKSIIIAALDTGCRRGELLKLKWSDVDLENRLIIIRAENSKTLRSRQVAMTNRLFNELANLYEQSPKINEFLVFGVTSVKKSFDTCKRIAGLDDLRFHDLRHTAATRLVSQNIPLPEVARILGHMQVSTTYRYTNLTLDTVRRASAALDSFHSRIECNSNISQMIN